MVAHRVLLALAVVPLTATLVSAQDPISVSWVARSQLRLETGEQPREVRDLWTRPTGTDLLPGVTGRAGAVGSYGEATISASYQRLGEHAFRIEIAETTWAEDTAWPTLRNGYARVGQHDTLLRIVPDREHRVRLRVQRRSDLLQSRGFYDSYCEVDLAGDGVPDLVTRTNQDVEHFFDVVLPAEGFDITTRTSQVLEPSSDDMQLVESLVIELLPLPLAQFENYGIAVGLGLEGSEVLRGSTRDLHLDSIGVPLAFGAESFGFQRLALPIPGTLCTLRNENFMALPFLYDARGEARIVHSFPAEVPFTFQIQLFALHPTVQQLMCSEGLEIAVANR